jgi:aryl-alcohol dehydrogenase-like predicted oxidoreductase
MQERTLGRDGLTVSALGLGCIINDVFPPDAAAGLRYPEAAMQHLGR